MGCCEKSVVLRRSQTRQQPDSRERERERERDAVVRARERCCCSGDYWGRRVTGMRMRSAMPFKKKSVRRKRTDSYVGEPAAPFFHDMPAAAQQLNAHRTRDAPCFSTAPLSFISFSPSFHRINCLYSFLHSVAVASLRLSIGLFARVRKEQHKIRLFSGQPRRQPDKSSPLTLVKSCLASLRSNRIRPRSTTAKGNIC